MKMFFANLRNQLIRFTYRGFVRKIFFLMDEEKIHHRMIAWGKVLGGNVFFRKPVSWCFNFSDSRLTQNICGLKFENPIGLAAGFDKNAEMIPVMREVGFGFTEIGSVTGRPCPGNPKPRLWRLPKTEGIVVNYGLNNQGAETIARRLSQCREKIYRIPLGINVAKTNSCETVETADAIADYLIGLRAFLKADIGEYFAINISCPNAFGGEPFTDPSRLNLLLAQVAKLEIKKPVFLKLSPDLSDEALDRLISLAEQYKLTGFICSNLTKRRDYSLIAPQEIIRAVNNPGGISGQPLAELSDQLIGKIYQKTKGQKIIIGCGGVADAAGAYKKIRLGASLLQLISALIFEGPQAVSQINLGLCRLLEKDGFKNISQAVGVEFR